MEVEWGGGEYEKIWKRVDHVYSRILGKLPSVGVFFITLLYRPYFSSGG